MDQVFNDYDEKHDDNYDKCEANNECLHKDHDCDDARAMTITKD